MANNDINKIDKELSIIDKNIFPEKDKDLNKIDKDKVLDKIKESLMSVKSLNAGGSNDNILELSYSLFNNDSSKISEKQKKRLLNISKVIESNQIVSINELLYSERSRIILYENYKIINEMIPQLPESIQTYVDNIISPDDFSKQSLNIIYDFDETNYSSNSTDLKNFLSIIKKNFDFLKKTYKIENKVIKYIKEALTYGDCFVAVLKLSEQIKEHLLNEITNGSTIEKKLITLEEHAQINDYILLDENTIDIKDYELKTIKELLTEEVDKSIKELSNDNNTHTKKQLQEFKDSLTDDKIKEDLVTLINENFIVNKDKYSIFNESDELAKDFGREKEYYAQAEKNLTANYERKLNIKKQNNKNNFDDLDNISGSIIKPLEQNRTIKLWADNFCYGYYYIDIAHKDTLADFGIQLGNKDAISIFTNPNINQDRLLRTKEEFIYNLLVRNIAKKLDKKSILQNIEFKNVIFNLLRQNYIFNKKIQLVYFDKDEVVHFKPNDDEVEYGVSLYKDILFTAKIYIAVLTSTLMIKIVRSPDKRIWYLDVGLEKDQEEVINSTMSDIKGRDIRMNDFDDIGKVIRHIGTFDDIWIPTFSGEKPLEIENLEGQSAEVENDFLEYLKKTMISGMGVPNPYVGYTDDIELAKMLTIDKIVA